MLTPEHHLMVDGISASAYESVRAITYGTQLDRV